MSNKPRKTGTRFGFTRGEISDTKSYPIRAHVKSVSTIPVYLGGTHFSKIYSLGLFILMIAKTWTGILHGDRRRRVLRTRPDQKKLCTMTVSLEHLILAIIIVHLYFPMYIENISKSSSSLSLVWLPLQQEDPTPLFSNSYNINYKYT